MFASYSDSIIAPTRNRKTGQEIVDSSIASNLKSGAVVVFVAAMFWMLFPATFYRLQAGAQRAAVATTKGMPYLMSATINNESRPFWGSSSNNSNDPVTVINLAGGTPAALAGEVFSLFLNQG